MAKKSTGTVQVAVPAKLAKDARAAIKQLIADSQPPKPIKRTVKVTDAQLKATMKKLRALQPMVQKIWAEYNRFADLDCEFLTSGDQGWASTQYDKFNKATNYIENNF